MTHHHAINTRALRMLVLLILAFSFGCSRHDEKINSRADALRLIQSSVNNNRYDDAIRIGKEWLKVEPNDGFVHAMIGQIYVGKASHSMESKQLLDEGFQYTDRALQLEPENTAVLDVAANTFEAAGDLFLPERCNRYQSALRVLDREDQLLRKHFDSPDPSWAKVKALNETTSARLGGKMQASGCLSPPQQAPFHKP